jgi:hypothetical protein
VKALALTMVLLFGCVAVPLPESFRKAGQFGNCLVCATAYADALKARGYDAEAIPVAVPGQATLLPLHAVVVVRTYYDPAWNRAGRTIESIGWGKLSK